MMMQKNKPAQKHCVLQFFTLHHQIETVAQRIEQRKTLYQILICIAGVMIKLLRIRRRRSPVRIRPVSQ